MGAGQSARVMLRGRMKAMEEPCSPALSLYLGLCTRLVVGGDILDGCSKEMGEAGSELIASGPSSKVLIFLLDGSLRDPTSS